MAVTWHASLPQVPQVDGNGADQGLNAVLFETASGRTRKRMRATTGIERAQFVFSLSAAQLSTWRGFWEGDLDYGAVNFTLPYPPSGNSEEFIILAPPQLAEWGSGQYTLSFPVEIV